MPENETVKPVVTPREARLSWRVIAVLGIVALVLLRAFAREVGMPIWVANPVSYTHLTLPTKA